MKTVFRFCDANNYLTMKSHAGKDGVHLPSDVWSITPAKLKIVLKRAFSHMDGAIEKSPFVSVATNVSELVKWGYSGGLKDIAFGVDHPEWRAPHIVEFSVPEESLISPSDIKAEFPEAASLTGIMRSEKETELLYFGNDLQTYIVRYTDNQYTNETFRKMMEEDEAAQLKEEMADLPPVQVSPIPSVSAKKVQADANQFELKRDAFLQTYRDAMVSSGCFGDLLTKLERVSVGDESAFALGMLLRKFGQAVVEMKKSEVLQAWCNVVMPYQS